MSNIDAEDLKQFNIDLENDLRRLHHKIPPPDKISETDIYIRDVISTFIWFIREGSLQNYARIDPPCLLKTFVIIFI